MMCMTTSYPPLPDRWLALRHCAGWEYHTFADGPLACVLLHVLRDPAGVLRDGEHGVARASVRLVLRDGAAFGVSVTADVGSLLQVLTVVGATLAGRRHDEAALGDMDKALMSALSGRARVSLDRNASLLPAPLLLPDQLARLAHHADRALAAGLPALIGHWQQGCAIDDPAVQGYVASLDSHAVAYCTGARDRLDVYNFIAAPLGNARNRAQAMHALPWLLPSMVAREVTGILAAIDQGLPLHAAVAIAFDVPREVVRWLGRRAVPANWVLDVRHLRRWLALLAWLPPERRPDDLAQCGDLLTLASALSAPLDYLDDAGQVATLARIGPCMRRWLAQCRTVDASALRDAQDFLRALFEAVRVGDGLDAQAADARVLAWCASIRVTRLLALSHAWHAAIARSTWAAEDDDPGAHWPPVLVQPWQAGNRTIVEMTSSGQLLAEGQAMAHCVGGYAIACRSGNSVIVTLRGAAGVSMSTAELHLHAAAPRITVAQHRAAHNAAPGPDCVRALRALLVHLNGPDVDQLLRRRLDFQAVQAVRRKDGDNRFNTFAQETARRLAA